MSRENQKRRTRRAILGAAEDLLRAGRHPTVAEVADAAEVSKATAYSYFPSQQLLLEEAGMQLVQAPALEEAVNSALAECGDDVVRRWEVFCPIHWDHFGRGEAVVRSLLRAQQDRWLEANAKGEADSVVVRQGRRRPLIDNVLAPLRPRIPDTAYRQLADSLALLVGIEPLVVLKDVCGTTLDEAVERVVWAGRVMIEATLRSGG